ncbi:MAG: hypothetical protein OSB09_00985 [Planctomycetota bacterium]|nr:hypothetical protein [Planctomycetota bacterium]
MTRMLIFCAMLTTGVLLQALQDRPPKVEFIEYSVTTSTNTELESDPRAVEPVPQPKSWSPEQRRSIQARLSSWSPIDRNELDRADSSTEDQLLLLESICQRELRRLGQSAGTAAEPLLYMNLKGGASLAYRSLRIHAGTGEIELPGGLVIRVPTSRIRATRVAAPTAPAHTLPPGSLVDTLSMIESIGRDEPIEKVRWNAWIQQGGPEGLVRLIPSERSKRLQNLTRIAWSLPTSPLPEADGKSTEQLERWMSSIRSRLREGFPTEQRREVLEKLDLWDQWLDMHGTQSYSSQTRYLQIRHQLRLLKLDIVKSTGF